MDRAVSIRRWVLREGEKPRGARRPAGPPNTAITVRPYDLRVAIGRVAVGQEPTLQASATVAVAPVGDPSGSVASPGPYELLERPPKVRETLRLAWRSRHLVVALSRGVIKRAFGRTILGPTWILLPLLMDTVGKTLIFGKVLQVNTGSAVPYFLFVLVGSTAWRAFQRSLYLGLRGFRQYQRHVDKFDFPLFFIPVAAGTRAVLEVGISILMILLTIVYYSLRLGHLLLNLGPSLLLAPLGLLLAFMFAWGLACWFGAVFQSARDVRFILRYLFPFWMLVTPVVYPLHTLSGNMYRLAEINPMAPIVEMVKIGLFGSGAIGPLGFTWAVVSACLSLTSGIWFLNRFGRRLVAGPKKRQILDEEDDDAAYA